MAQAETIGGELGNLRWWVSADSMNVFAEIPKGEKGIPTVDQVVERLSKNGITAEIDREALENLLGEGSGTPVPIARGTPPKPPVEGRLEYFVDLQSLDRRPVEDETGRLDYKNLRMFQNVTEGTPLVRKHDPVPGEPGTDVFGKLIPPAQVPRIQLPIGEGIRLEEDGYLAVADQDGALSCVDGRLTVTQLFTVPKDVSYSSGNIDFKGTVEIGRDVLSGFVVKAKGDVVVHGIVEAATIIAGGDIRIEGGFQGGGKGKLKAAGTVRIGFGNEGSIEAGKDIVVKSYLSNCQVAAREGVFVESSKGQITGGRTRAGEKIYSATLGSKMGVATTVQIGLDSEILDKITAAEEILAVTAAVGLPNEHRKRELAEMREELQRNQAGEIVVDNTAFPGVTIRFPGAELDLTDPVRRVIFYVDKWKIKTRPLEKPC